MRNLIGATVAAAAVATLVGAATVGAQPQRGPGGPGGPGQGRGRGGPPVPVVMVLDENCDGNIDQGEIARAPQNLLKRRDAHPRRAPSAAPGRRAAAAESAVRARA